MPELPARETTLVVLLGASAWPQAPRFPGSEAFANSAAALRRYFAETYKLPPANLLDLFDSPDEPITLHRRIERFLREQEGATTDLILYFIGHGGFAPPADTYCLATRCALESNLALSTLTVDNLAYTIKENARQVRRFVVLDCCYAATASQAFQGGGPGEVAERQLIDAFDEPGKEEAAETLPTRGTALLCSSSPTLPSHLTPDGRSTMFTEALLEGLRSGDQRSRGAITLRQAAERTRDVLQRRYPTGAPRPELHSPDQREGDLADVPLFPQPRPSDPATGRPDTAFTPDDSVIQCYVVLSETEARTSRLPSVIRRTLSKYKSEIEKSRRPLREKPHVVSAAQLVDSPADFANAVEALCSADIAVFDVTSYEPAVMLLLGIRSVVRRGVTLCSAGGDYVIGNPIEHPFNIREVNILSHSVEQIDRGEPIDLIGGKILAGLDQIAQRPDYLDLPAFEEVRRLAPDRSTWAPKDYTEQVLVLCPFRPDYQKNNWKLHLRPNLPVYIRRSAGTASDPAVVRTLDMKSPRLVSQSLYEAIRLTSMCVVDWTGWQANVFFELGVRLAVSEIGAVSILEDRPDAVGIDLPREERLRVTARQRASLRELFAPILYRAPAPGEEEMDEDHAAFEAMVASYKDLIAHGAGTAPARGLLPADFTYKTVTRCFDWRMEVSARPVHAELLEAADLLSLGEIDSAGRSPVLYPGNEVLVQKAEDGALERRLAAWYYINERYPLAEIEADPKLRDLYLHLGDLLSRTLRERPVRAGDSELAQSIRKKVKLLKMEKRIETDG